MILQNITSSLTLLALLCSLVGVYSFQPAPARAETHQPQYCPINGEIETSFHNPGESTVGDEFSATIRVVNHSTYVFGGVRVVVAAYANESDIVPVYWSVADDVLQLDPKGGGTVSFDLDLTAVPAGEYTLKAFAAQGDETTMLGTVMLGGANTDTWQITKTTPQSNYISMSVVVNDERFTGNDISIEHGSAIAVQIETTNNNDRTVIKGSDVLGVITQGKVPLGAAVGDDHIEEIGLIPGHTRKTVLHDGFAIGGDYTTYAALVNPNALQPIMSVPMNVTGGYDEEKWAYISQIGLSNYPLTADDEVVACVRYIGVEDGEHQFLEPLAVEMSFVGEAGQVTQGRVDAEFDVPSDYFVFSPNTSFGGLDLTVDFLQQRHRLVTNRTDVIEADNVSQNPELVEDTERMAEEEAKANDALMVVDTIALNFTCDDMDCESVNQDQSGIANSSDSAEKSSFWFYVGVVLAALLLMYLILRRLGPEDAGSSSEVSDNEIQ